MAATMSRIDGPHNPEYWRDDRNKRVTLRAPVKRGAASRDQELLAIRPVNITGHASAIRRRQHSNRRAVQRFEALEHRHWHGEVASRSHQFDFVLVVAFAKIGRTGRTGREIAARVNTRVRCRLPSPSTPERLFVSPADGASPSRVASGIISRSRGGSRRNDLNGRCIPRERT